MSEKDDLREQFEIAALALIEVLEAEDIGDHCCYSIREAMRQVRITIPDREPVKKGKGKTPELPPALSESVAPSEPVEPTPSTSPAGEPTPSVSAEPSPTPSASAKPAKA